MKFVEGIPIYLQIIEEIKNKILSGQYEAGQRIPSVRDLALEYAVNPNTMQKALSECETQKLVYSMGPQGRFITDDRAYIQQLKEHKIEDIVQEFLSQMQLLSISKQEVIEWITKSKERTNVTNRN